MWLAILRIVFLLPHVLPFLKRRHLSRPILAKIFVAANFVFVVAKAIALLVVLPAMASFVAWWILVVLSGASVAAQRACLHHLRSSHAQPRREYCAASSGVPRFFHGGLRAVA